MDIKKKGQVFTPDYIVAEMLDKIGFCQDNVFHKVILEPSFGDGQFLVAIITRIIQEGQKHNLSNLKILEIIKKNVIGFEIDKTFYDIAIEKIRRVLSTYKIGYHESFPNLHNGDTIELHSAYNNKVDLVIGNPPYVNTHNLNNREIVKSFEFSKKGMSDLYITFFEMGLKMLRSDGKLCFITPNSYFNSVAGRIMREYIIDNHLLTYIKNFGHYQVFDNITTYCCITMLDKQNKKNEIIYEKKDMSKNQLKYSDFYINNLFCFEKSNNFENIINYDGKKHCCVRNGCATLLDSFFINSELSEMSKFAIPIIKASTNKKYKCFYPYDKTGKIISFDIIEKAEPVTAQYLLNNKELLIKRAIEKPEYWYAFGRTQAIADTYKTKYIVNTLYKDISDIRVDLCDVGCAVYSGLYILTDANIKIIRNILISQDYLDYVKTFGRYKNGGYYTITSKEIEKYLNYKINEDKT